MLEKVSDNIDIILGKKRDKKHLEIEEELLSLKTNQGQIKKLQIETKDDYDIDNSHFPFIPKLERKLYAVEQLSSKIQDAKNYGGKSTD